MLALTLLKIMGGTKADHDTSLTSLATGAAILTMSKIFYYVRLDAVVGGTFPNMNMIAAHKYEDLNLPRSITLPYTSLDTMAGVTSPPNGAAISTMSKIFDITSLDAVGERDYVSSIEK